MMMSTQEGRCYVPTNLTTGFFVSKLTLCSVDEPDMLTRDANQKANRDSRQHRMLPCASG